jgi:hypothetical protein
MNKQSDPQSIIEQKVIALYYVIPENDFVSRLEKELLGDGWRTYQAARSAMPGGRRVTLLRLGLSGALVVALAAGFLFTPQGRAWAQKALQFFIPGGSDAFTVATMRWVDQTPGEAAPTLTPWIAPRPAFFSDCGDFSAPRCSFARIRSKVNFSVKQLGVIPESFFFTGATGGPEKVELFYDTKDHSGFLTITEEPWTGSPEQTSLEVGASAVVETVRIGGVTGEYVQGGYVAKASGDSSPVWDGSIDAQTLQWVDEGVFYLMTSDGPAFPMDRDAFTALAESLTTEEVAAALTPVPATATPEPTFDFHLYFPLTLAQVESQAGFNILKPTKLPEFLSFLGTSYDGEHKVAKLFYPIDQNRYGYNTDNLVLSEQLAPAGVDCVLCGFVKGDFAAAEADYSYKVVGADATIESVQIGDITGEYVEGAWYSENDSGMLWHNDPYQKLLRWRANGTAFELSFFGMEVAKEDLLAIAESMK